MFFHVAGQNKKKKKTTKKPPTLRISRQGEILIAFPAPAVPGPGAAQGPAHTHSAQEFDRGDKKRFGGDEQTAKCT